MNYKISSHHLLILVAFLLMALMAIIPVVTSGMNDSHGNTVTSKRIDAHHNHHDNPASNAQGASAPDLPDNVGSNNNPSQ